ncbi:MAG: glycopeptide antibiotics resistance protein [Arenicella sp.]|jgi:glycopeptide antibiotics resistance protein
MLMAFLQKKESAGEKKLNLSNLRLYLVVILAGIAIGVFVELIQGNYIYKRYYDTEDIIVNSIGTVIGGLGYTLIGRKLV